MSGVVLDASAYVKQKRQLLLLERDAEAAKVSAASSSSEALSLLEGAGAAVTRLSFSDRRSTATGRVVVELSTRGGRVVATRLSAGDIVSVRPHHQPKAAGRGPAKGGRKGSGDVADGEEGVLVAVGESKLEVAIDDGGRGVLGGDDPAGHHDLAGHLFAVIRVGSDVTFKRCNEALIQFERAFSTPTHPAYALCGVLYRGAEPRFEGDSKLQLSHAQQNALAPLNEIQQDAVRRAMCSKDVFAFHGPPGTGKTSTLVSFVVAEVLRGSRVLVCAPSNVAVDNIAEKLAAFRGDAKVRFVRAGHPARVMESVAEFTLDARLAQTDEMALARDIRSELSDLDARAESSRGGARRAIRMEQRTLRKELRRREGDALKRLLGRVECMLATTAGSGGRVLDNMTVTEPIDVVCVDEAGMATEASSLIAVLKGKRLVLAGDPFQLAPTVISEQAAGLGLGQTLLDRMFADPKLHKSAVRMLEVQYRMNAVISNWSSQALYENRLKAAPSVGQRTLEGLRSSVDGGASEAGKSVVAMGDMDLLQQPWVLIDTSSCGFYESQDGDASSETAGDRSVSPASQSKSNEGEARIVVAHVQKLLEAGISDTAIGVISPYAGQVTLLRSKLRGGVAGKGLEISTVDSFQGREKDAIVISLVRSNDQGSVGFLKDSRRLNVAITRAKRHVAIVCDSATVSNDPFCSAMIDYASEHGDYQVADDGITTHVQGNSVSALPSEQLTTPSRSAKSRQVSATSKEEDKGRRKGNHRMPRNGQKRSRGKIETASQDKEHQETSGASLENEVRSFTHDISQEVKVFPSSLTAADRRNVHSLAEELGLLHVTAGEGDARFITISKPVKESSANGKLKPSSEASELPTISGATIGNDGVTFSEGGRFQLLRDSDEYGDDQEGGETRDASPERAETPATHCADNSGAASSGPNISTTKADGSQDGNDTLRQLALERQKRREGQSQGGESMQPRSRGANSREGNSSGLSPSTERIIVAGQLLGGSAAKEKAATTAARARLSSRLEEQASSRRRKGKAKK